ncbi:hypothetical protein [Edaphobacter dinghuensis]|uniref:Alpha-L-rhamnosidase six-hairpin glycosidase domain-containing protein n=1 Tax=Edaphobacter dinghuensis TaxID=1560005 RepID=A0A917H3F3_9BACT|nr:hypothetical protein [Edaphobacter dinghuensis]GGG66323.1 hypothetical protein GCM10011585_05220 [Edaphobacter dinghuensis]
MFFERAASRGGVTRRQVNKALCLVPFLMSASLRGETHDAKSELEFDSSDIALVNSFRWAKQEAMSYVFDGDPVGPWYEAALPGRHAFCMRDTSHQADGAQALGLARYNHNMLRKFAENIAASRDWCSYWEIDRLNRPAPVDYKSDAEFWYNLPANFDVLDACYRMYLWTGDTSYIEDPVFLNFYDRTMTDYIERWQLSPERVMKRTSNIETPPFFRGDPTYEESSRDNLVGIDLLATQYAAYRAYAAIQSIRGNGQAARRSMENAAEMKRLINTTWWNAAGGYFYAFFNKQHQFIGRAGADVLYRDAAEAGPKTASALQTLLATMKTEPVSAVEAKSHYAEILYRYGDAAAARAQILDLTREGRERREYPEVSYSVMGAMTMGLMGVRVEPTQPPAKIAAGRHLAVVVETMPRLTAATGWAELRNLPVQGSVIGVRHEGERSTKLTNQGTKALVWRAVFPGSFAALLVGGKPLKAHAGSAYRGEATSSVEVMVPAGDTVAVRVAS